MNGFKIPFNRPPFQKFEASNPKFSYAEVEQLRLAILKLQSSGSVVECSNVPGQFISGIFLTPKSDGTFRFILNLKILNKFIDTQHFKMEDIRTATKLISKDCYMTSIDLQEAYFLVPIHEESKKFLRFKFNHKTFEFQCLPFGLSLAPLVFTKLLKPVISYLRDKGLLLVVYLDDILCIDNTYNSCRNSVMKTVNLLSELGFIINKKKSNLIPNQKQPFLGFVLDSRNMSLNLTDQKRLKILSQVKHMYKIRSLSIREFAKFLGLLCSVCPAVAYGWIYTKRLEREKFLALRNSNDNYDGYMTLPPDLKSDFSWWQNNILTSNNPIRSGRFIIEIYSDASLTGWGIFCNGERANGFWDSVEAEAHINLLELKAAFIGLQCFANKLTNAEILLRIDNTTAISYINRYGGVQYKHLNEISRTIWQWCEERRLHIYASYIKSKDNTEADQESRHSNIDTEWSLSQSGFDEIVNVFGNPQIDLFATRLNSKCYRYVSWKRDPSAFDIDAFTLDWNLHFFYAFPPFSLILKCLRKIINDSATGIMVVPYWPSQPWYPLFVALSQSRLVYLEPNPTLLLSPFRTPHPLWKRLTLVSSLLSSKRTQDNRYQQAQSKL